MSQTLYATFADGVHAEKAVGALLDHGVLKESISLVAKNTGTFEETFDTDDADDEAKTGITTTTPADAGVGATKGAGIGLSVGILAGLASIVVPGVGIVLGSGALAAAFGAAAATAAAGAVAGGVTGYFKDQGLPDDAVRTYTNRLETGGTLVAVMLPSGGIDVTTGREIVSKYHGADMNVF